MGKQSWEYNNAGISSVTLENIPENQEFPRNQGNSGFSVGINFET